MGRGRPRFPGSIDPTESRRGRPDAGDGESGSASPRLGPEMVERVPIDLVILFRASVGVDAENHLWSRRPSESTGGYQCSTVFGGVLRAGSGIVLIERRGQETEHPGRR